jgi:hypothetical protein
VELDDILEALNKAKKAEDLLKDLWYLIGPYGNIESIVEGHNKYQARVFMQDLQKYFNFDDSE